MLLQVWGESLVSPELKEIVDEMTGALAALFLGYLTSWHQKQGMSKRRAEQASASELPAYIALCQGFVVQCALNAHFQESQFLNSISKLLKKVDR